MTYNPTTRTFVPISDLNPNTQHPTVVGVIIGKTDVKGFPDRRNFGSERFTFSFTIKDSPEHFINVSSWGTEQYIRGLSSRFRIGDCVILENPLVAAKDPEKEDRFCPSTPSFCRLLVTQSHSAIRLCSNVEVEARLFPLFHVPVKDPGDFYSLGDIVANGHSLEGSVLNILAAVKSIGETRPFTTANDRRGQRLELKLFDETVNSFSLICWDIESIQLLQTLVPGETVLFIADVRITFDNFHGAMIATVTAKTIITINPDTQEANMLYSFAREFAESGGLDEPDRQAGNSVQLDSISEVLTVSQMRLRAQESHNAFCAVSYVFISAMALDSAVSRVIRSRCARCRFVVTEDVGLCPNVTCPGREQRLEAVTGFEIPVDISDHTGTLQSCSLAGRMAEKTLGCTVLPAVGARRGLRCTILSCSPADPVEVKQSFLSVGAHAADLQPPPLK
ncbi:meiosis-specific with OB domain-containing protein-like [Denticeps clupeoides]|uniref:meiosis-specific with OB domain-containing protein-like n=1 Tax=Denticeps clupeoides TaxID=299321 RepID=UPI0010A590FF|nr:meiosis-specific with OB domain-containing protein-like [Denticeps clupeoides]